MNMHTALILDTETSSLKGLPIEIAHCGIVIENGALVYDKENMFNQLYSIGDERIELGAMSTHNIIDSDLLGMPHFSEFRLPEGVDYLIGHNIDYDINTIALCGDQPKVKSICTLAIARKLLPDLNTHKLTTLMYHFLRHETARELIKNAHRASEDVYFTAILCAKLMKINDITSIEQLYALSEDARIPDRMHFGKHRGTLLTELDPGYIKWLRKQDNVDLYLMKALDRL